MKQKTQTIGTFNKMNMAETRLPRRVVSPRRASAFAALLASLFYTPLALAQPPYGGPPDGGGPDGPPRMQGGPGRMGRPPFGGPGRMTLAQTPLTVLESGLKLTASQKTKVAQIQQQLRSQRPAFMGDPGGPPPDPQAMRASMDRMHSAALSADRKIEALLTADQKQALVGLKKEMQVLRDAHIPLELYGQLKLTDDQKQQIAALAPAGGQEDGPRGGNREARQALETKAMAILTEEQKQIVEQFRQSHPRPDRGRGGRGRDGRPPMDGSGPPPPDGHGPPPDGNGPPPDGNGPPPEGDGAPPPADGHGPPPEENRPPDTIDAAL